MFRSRCTVQIGFDADPGDLSPRWANTGFTWTDVGDAVLSYDVMRGGPELAGISPAVGTLVLDNRTGDFDPSNTGGAYYPDLRVGKPIRILEQINLLPLLVSTGDDASDLTGTGGSTISASGTSPKSGTSSIRIAGGTGFRYLTGSNAMPVFAGEPLTAIAAFLRTSGTGRSCRVQIRFYDSGGSFLSTVSGDYVTSTTSWQQVSVSTTAPAGAAFATVYFAILSGAGGDVHYVDEVALVPAAGAEALTWFPGGPREVFRGQIDSWLPAPFYPDWSTCTVSLSGYLTAMAAAPTGESMWATLVDRSAPSLWWRFGDANPPAGAIDSSGNGHRGRYRAALGSTPITITDGLVLDDSNGAVNLDSTWLQYVESATGWVWTATSFTVAMWVQAFPGAAACTLADSSRFTIEMDSSGNIDVDVLGVTASTSGFDLRDGEPHLIFVAVGAGTVAVTLDMVAAGSGSGIFTAARVNQRIYVGRDQAGTVASYASFTIDEFVIWQGVELTPDWFYLAGRSCAIRPGDAIGRAQPADVAQFLIDLFGSPVADGATASPADSAPLRIDRTPMGSLLDMLGTAALLGRLSIYEAADGTPTVLPLSYIPSSSLAYLPTPTWGIDPGDFRYRGAPVIDYGEQAILNTVVINRPAGGSPITYTDAASVSAVGVRSISLDTWSTVDTNARDLAGWILAQFATEHRRVLEVRPDCTLVDAAQMGLWHELGDVCTVSDVTVDGRTIDTVVRITSKRVARTTNAEGVPVLEVVLGCAPVRVQPMVLDSSDYGGLDTGGVWGP